MNEEESIDASEEHARVQLCKRTPRQIAIEPRPTRHARALEITAQLWCL